MAALNPSPVHSLARHLGASILVVHAEPLLEQGRPLPGRLERFSAVLFHRDRVIAFALPAQQTAFSAQQAATLTRRLPGCVLVAERASRRAWPVVRAALRAAGHPAQDGQRLIDLARLHRSHDAAVTAGSRAHPDDDAPWEACDVLVRAILQRGPNDIGAVIERA